MVLSADDRHAIGELLHLHGHLVDNGEFDRLDELLTDAIVYDVTDLGGGTLSGIAAFRDAALTLGDGNPVGHHVTNIIITAVSDDLVEARSKGLGVMADGTVGSVTYQDVISRTESGWRIARRQVLARRRPLGATP